MATIASLVLGMAIAFLSTEAIESRDSHPKYAYAKAKQEAVAKVSEGRCKAFFLGNYGIDPAELLKSLEFKLASVDLDLGYCGYTRRADCQPALVVECMDIIGEVGVPFVVIHELAHVAECRTGLALPDDPRDIADSGTLAERACFGRGLFDEGKSSGVSHD